MRKTSERRAFKKLNLRQQQIIGLIKFPLKAFAFAEMLHTLQPISSVSRAPTAWLQSDTRGACIKCVRSEFYYCHLKTCIQFIRSNFVRSRQKRAKSANWHAIERESDVSLVFSVHVLRRRRRSIKLHGSHIHANSVFPLCLRLVRKLASLCLPCSCSFALCLGSFAISLLLFRWEITIQIVSTWV